MIHVQEFKKIEYEWDVVINGKKVLPRYAFVNQRDWFSHLKKLGHPKLNRAFEILDQVPSNSIRYRELSNHLYKRLLEKLVEWNEK